MMRSWCSWAPPGRQARTCPLCASARALPRVPILIGLPVALDAEELPHRVDPPESRPTILARAVEPRRGTVEELLHDAVGQRLQRRVILGAEPPAMARQLFLRDPLELAPEGGHRGLELEGAVPAHEAGHLLLDDRLHLRDLRAPLLQALRHDAGESVEIVEED